MLVSPWIMEMILGMFKINAILILDGLKIVRLTSLYRSVNLPPYSRSVSSSCPR
jgi:hypothetical protein